MKRKFKQVVASIVVGAMIGGSIHEARANALVIAVCITVAAAAATTGVAIIVHSCRPRWYCLWDPESELKEIKQITRRQARIAGKKILAGPFEDERAAFNTCITNNIPVPDHPFLYENEVEPNIFIETSTNLKDWTVTADLTGQDPEDFTWTDPRVPDKQRFYRVKFVPVTL